jgi:hypothetical protein
MRKISLLLATALILLSSFTANAVLNMGGKTIFTGTLIEVLEPGSATQIQSIINNIGDASAAKPYVIHLGPGVYDIGTTGIVMKEWVSIQGSGQEATKITGTVSTGAPDATSSILVGANNTSLSDLTVENTGEVTSIAIFNFNASPLIERVTATGSSLSNSYGVYNWYSFSPTMTNVTATGSGLGSGGLNTTGVFNEGSSPTMTNVTATGSGGSNNNYGVNNRSSSPAMTNVTATGSGGAYSYGVHNDSSSPTMTNVTATGSGGANNFGVYILSSSPMIKDSSIEGNTVGMVIDGTSTSTGTRVVNSKIVGGVNDGASGTTNCRGTYKADLSNQDC